MTPCRDIFARISTHPMSRIDELLPDRWKKERDTQQAAADSIVAPPVPPPAAAVPAAAE